MADKMREYLEPTEFLDFDKAEVYEFALKNSEDAKTEIEKAVKLYYAVRDGFYYSPKVLDLRKEGLKASNLLSRNRGYCVEKAVLLSAVARAVGIPSRLSFYNVRNHIATERIEKLLQTNVLVFHGASELFLNGKWVKATPAFNATLCNMLGVEPLEFDGTKDSIFQQYSKAGDTFMEYLHDYGNFADLPYELYLSELKRHYSHLFQHEKYMKADMIYELTA